MADVESNININIDASQALANLRALQREISAFHTSMAKGGAAAQAASNNLANNLVNQINATGKFSAQFTNVASTTEAFTTALEKNQFTLREYFRYTGAATKTFGKMFAQEFETISTVTRERVKDLQTQYIKLGKDANGAIQAIKVRPLALDMEDLGTKTQMAAQRTQILNQLLQQGSTNLLNFGKNTQWAGRQLMVGFTIPLMMFGSQAAKAFSDVETQMIRFKRVYGDLQTSSSDAMAMSEDIRKLASDYTKYGIAVADTIKLAADAAATGKQGAELMEQVASATKLAVLGGIDQQQALETTISLTNAFGIAAEDLAKKTNFLNAVENQTVTSIDDLTTAIPKAAPVIQQLGGSVEDLTFFLTAMREGGVNAAEGANALKSGLASMINPTKAASEFLGSFGINIKGLVEANKGDLKGTVIGFAEALDKLDPLNRAQAIEKLFGKFQFARMSTLFQNVIAEGSQANKVLELSNATAEELAILSEREMKTMENSPLYKFKKAIEDLKNTLVPIGEQFLKAITPVVQFIGGILEKFNGLSDGAKKFVVTLTAILAGIGPVALMTFGLLANGVANIIKLFTAVKRVFNGAGGASQDLGSQTQFMTQAQMEAASAASSLEQAHAALKQTFTSEANAVDMLTAAYQRAITAQRGFSGGPVPNTRSTKPKNFASGGVVVTGPGGPKDDAIPANLSNGEVVLSVDTVNKNPGVVAALLTGRRINVPGFANGSKSVATGFGYSQGHFSGYQSATGQQLLDMAKNDADLAAIKQRLASQAKLLSEISGNVVKYEDMLTHEFQVYDNRVVGQSMALNTMLGQSGAKGGAAPADMVQEEYAGQRGQAHGMAANYMERAGVDPEKIKSTMVDLADEVDAGIQDFITKTGKAAKDVKISGDDLDRIMQNAYSKVASRNQELATAYGEMSEISGIASVQKTTSGSNNRLSLSRMREWYKRQTTRDANYDAGVQYSENPDKPYLAKIAKRQFASGTYETARQVRDQDPQAFKELLQEKDSAKRLAMLKASAKRLGIKFVESASDGFADGANKGLEAKSPSKKAEKAGKNGADGFIKGAKSGAEESTQAGREQARRTNQGVEAEQAAARAAGKKVGDAAAQGVASAGGGRGPNINPTLMDRFDQSRLGSKFNSSKMGRRLNARMAFSDESFGADAPQNRTKALVGKATGIGMGVTSALAVASAIPGPVGETAQKALPIAGAVTSILPMLTSPVGAAVVAVGALVAATYAQKKAFDDAQNSVLDFSEKVGASTSAIEGFSKFAGTVSATEIMRKRREAGINPFQIQTGKTTWGQAFVGSEEGKGMLSSVKQNIKQNGSASASSSIVAQAASAVMTGAMSAQQARSYVAAIGEQLGDSSFSIKANAQLITLLGPNGENVLKDGMSIRTKLIEDQRSKSDVAMKGLKKASGWTMGDVGNTALGIGGGAAAGAAAGAIVGSAVPIIGTAVGAIGGAIVGAIAGGIFQQRDRQKRIGASSAAAIAMQKQELEVEQQMLDSLDQEYEKKYANLMAAGKQAEAEKLTNQYLTDRQGLLDQQAETVQAISTNFKGSSEDVQNALTSGAEKAITKKYKGTVQEDLVPLALQNINDSSMTKEQKYVIKMEMASGNIDPMRMISIMETFGDDQKSIDKMMTIITKFGGTTGSQTQQVVDLFDGNKTIQKSIVAKVEAAKTSADAQKILTMWSAVGQGTARSPELKVVANYIEKNPAVQKKLTEIIDGITKQKGKFDLTIATKILGADSVAMKALRENWDYFSKLTDKEQQIYMQELAVISQKVVSNKDPLVQAWLKTPEGTPYAVKTDAEQLSGYLNYEAYTVTKAAGNIEYKAPGPGGGGGGGGPQASAIDGLTKDLRDVQKNQIVPKVGWDANMKILRGLFSGKDGKGNAKREITLYSGLQNDMRKLGAGEDVIQLIAGMDPAEFEKRKKSLFNFDNNGNIKSFKDDLVTIGEAMRSIQLGKFMDQQQASAKMTGYQTSALAKLKNAGVDTATAYAMVADQATASAIANSKLSPEKLQQMANAAKKAADAMLEFNTRTNLASSVQEFNDKKALLLKLGAQAKNFTQEQMTEILNNKDLQTMILHPEFNQTEFNEKLKQVAEAANVEIAIKSLTVEGLTDMFNTGFNNAMAEINAKEQKIQIQFENVTKGDNSIIKSAENQIAGINYQVGQWNAQLKGIEDQEKVINESYDKRKEALNTIAQMNERISNQQKGQLGLAQALASGDMAQAARAALDMRSQAAGYAIQDQQAALEESRKDALGGVRSDKGYSRVEIETQVKNLNDQIFKIQQQQLIPAQERVRLATIERDRQLELVTAGGLTKQQWNEIKNNIDLAYMSSGKYQQSISIAKDSVKKILDYWNSVPKTYETLYTITTKYAGAGAPLAGVQSSTNNGKTEAEIQKAAANVQKAKDDIATANKLYSVPGMTSVAIAMTSAANKVIAANGYNSGGSVDGVGNYDNVPAMLTPGEFVVNRNSVGKYGRGMLKAINAGTYSEPSIPMLSGMDPIPTADISRGASVVQSSNSNSVYNYTLTVNARTDSNANEIAQTVMAKLRNMGENSPTMRGVRR
jgi:TP901 family phage tail tape measure protein